MNLPTFHGSKVYEDPEGFIDLVFRVVGFIGVTSREKSQLATYELKNVEQVWCEQ